MQTFTHIIRMFIHDTKSIFLCLKTKIQRLTHMLWMFIHESIFSILTGILNPFTVILRMCVPDMKYIYFLLSEVPMDPFTHTYYTDFTQ